MSQLIEKPLSSMPPPPNSLGLHRGDVIRLKPGDPQMTVIDVSIRGRTLCEWFASERLHRARLAPSSVASKQELAIGLQNPIKVFRC